MTSQSALPEDGQAASPPQHIPVMLAEVLEALSADAPETRRLVDGTAGAGGHSQALLDAGISEALLCDLDAQALAIARARLAGYGERVNFFYGSYINMGQAARALGWAAADAILLDLGLSSLQLDDRRRGFAFRFDAPLDMRFDAASGTTAADVLNSSPEAALAQLFYRYGEEKYARRIARAIIHARPLESTSQLARLVADALPAAARRKAKIHPATKVFQALRIAVNGELQAVEAVIPIAIDLLRPGGRLAVLSYHSLEDRIVKRRFRELATTVVAPPGMASIKERRARVRRLWRKPLPPSSAEIAANPRARSAKLRVVEKLE